MIPEYPKWHDLTGETLGVRKCHQTKLNQLMYEINEYTTNGEIYLFCVREHGDWSIIHVEPNPTKGTFEQIKTDLENYVMTDLL